jgi:single-strand DNA-binding protein
MSKSLNQCQFIGHLGKDPRVAFTSNGTPVATMSLAMNSTFRKKDKDGKDVEVEKTEWIRLVAWRKLADIVGQYLHSGDQIFVTTHVANRTYEDKDGVKRYTTEFVIDELVMLGSKKTSDSNGIPIPEEELVPSDSETPAIVVETPAPSKTF